MRKRRVRKLTDSQWMTVAGAVLVAVFLTAMGVGAGNLNLVLVALLLLVLVAVGVVLIGYRQADPLVPGQGTVVWASAWAGDPATRHWIVATNWPMSSQPPSTTADRSRVSQVRRSGRSRRNSRAAL